MKILLTALPGMGKSTVIKKFISLYEGNKHGIIASEMRDQSGNRVGFKSINMNGDERVFMHITDIESGLLIGGKYKVDLNVLNDFVVPELLISLKDLDSLLILDEIGRAQASSSKFLHTVDKLLASEANILGTIVYDEPWSIKYKTNPNVLLIEVTQENRDELPKLLLSIFNNIKSFNKLNLNQQNAISKELIHFIKENKFIQANKLFNNSVLYISQGKVNLIESNENCSSYQIGGKHRDHKVVLNKAKGEFKCDCDLFNGKGVYLNKPGVCSHIESVKFYCL